MTIIEITQGNLPGHEWIGLEAKVVASTDPVRVGEKGRIVGETKNTIVLETPDKELVLPKREVNLEVKWNNKKLVLNARKWCFRPEDRIKTWAKKKN